VALILDVRDPRIEAVASLAGPTSYLVQAYLDHPNRSVIFRQDFLRRLLDGEEGPVEARRRIVACSPASFAETLIRVQPHHGSADLNVPEATGDILRRAWQRGTPCGRPGGLVVPVR